MTAKESLALWCVYRDEQPKPLREYRLWSHDEGRLTDAEFKRREAIADEKSAARWRQVVREHLPRLRSETDDA